MLRRDLARCQTLLTFLALAALGFHPALAACPPPETPPQTVERVEDARTIVLRDGTRLRLAGIEPAAAFLGEDPEQASDPVADPLPGHLEALLAGAPVKFQAVADAPDRHRRIPALLFLSTGEFLQARLVAEGVAIAFAAKENLPCFDELRAAERVARESRTGAWREAGPLPANRPEIVAARIGRFAIVEGRVLSVATRYTASWLDFGRDWSTDVTVRIDRADRAKFGGEAALEALAGQEVTVRGYLTQSRGPLLEAGSPTAIEILATPGENRAAPGGD